MRIALVTLGYRPYRTSGLDMSSERLVTGLLGDGHEVTVFAAAPGPVTETFSHSRLKIYRQPIGRSNWIAYSYWAAHFVKQVGRSQPFDVVHFADIQFAYAYQGPFVAGLQHSFIQKRSIVRPYQLKYPYYLLSEWLAERPALRRARGLLAGSATAQAEYICHYGVEPGKIHLTRHGIDVDFFKPNPAGKVMRSRLGIGADEPVILFVGFVTPRKGLEYLAQALPEMKPRPRLVIAGKWKSSYRQRFMAKLGPAAAQVLEAGFVPDEDMPACYSMADVYVSPSLMEGFGLPPAEALACGTPVVTVRAGATSEVVGPGGILVEPRDAAGLARAVSTLLGDESLRRRMAELGREHVIREFNLKRVVTATVEAYQRFR